MFYSMLMSLDLTKNVVTLYLYVFDGSTFKKTFIIV